MQPTSRIENVAARFAPYIDELREFLGTRARPCGSLEDLSPFVLALQDTSFREEVASLLRSIFYREAERVPRAELAQVLMVAVGGTALEPPTEESGESLAKIAAFTNEALQPQRQRPETSEAEAVLDPPSYPPPSVEEQPALPVVMQSELHGAAKASGTFVPPSQGSPRAATTSHESGMHEINGRLSAAISHAAAQAADAQSQTDPATAVAPSAPERLVPVVTEGRARKPPRGRTGQSWLSRFYWIPGVCLLLLALATAWQLSKRQVASARGSAVPTPQLVPAPFPQVSMDRPTDPVRPATQPPAAKLSPELHAEAPAPGTGTAPATRSSTLSTRNSVGRGTPGGKAAPSAGVRSIAPARATLDPREGVFLASSGLMAAHLVYAPAPNYPKLASFARVEGEVIVQVVVSREGSVAATHVLDGPHLLRGAAEHAVRRWRYRPYLVDGRPTDVATIVTVNFRLKH